MKPSPVQLLQSTIEKISVDSSGEPQPEHGTASGEDVELQVQENCRPFSEYWNEENPVVVPGIEGRTYLVRLGIRTDPERSKDLAYAFELIVSGVVACVPENLGPDFGAEQAARQYGFAMLYGAMREQFLTVTSRMRHGPRLLPTVSFMEPVAEQGNEEHKQPERLKGKTSTRSKSSH